MHASLSLSLSLSLSFIHLFFRSLGIPHFASGVPFLPFASHRSPIDPSAVLYMHVLQLGLENAL